MTLCCRESCNICYLTCQQQNNDGAQNGADASETLQSERARSKCSWATYAPTAPTQPTAGSHKQSKEKNKSHVSHLLMKDLTCPNHPHLPDLKISLRQESQQPKHAGRSREKARTQIVRPTPPMKFCNGPHMISKDTRPATRPLTSRHTASTAYSKLPSRSSACPVT